MVQNRGDPLVRKNYLSLSCEKLTGSACLSMPFMFLISQMDIITHLTLVIFVSTGYSTTNAFRTNCCTKHQTPTVLFDMKSFSELCFGDFIKTQHCLSFCVDREKPENWEWHTTTPNDFVQFCYIPTNVLPLILVEVEAILIGIPEHNLPSRADDSKNVWQEPCVPWTEPPVLMRCEEVCHVLENKSGDIHAIGDSCNSCGQMCCRTPKSKFSNFLFPHSLGFYIAAIKYEMCFLRTKLGPLRVIWNVSSSGGYLKETPTFQAILIVHHNQICVCYLYWQHTPSRNACSSAINTHQDSEPRKQCHTKCLSHNIGELFFR